MDEINDFFDFSKDFERKINTEGFAPPCKRETHDYKPVKREFVGNQYASSISQQEELNLLKMDVDQEENISHAGTSHLDTLEDLSDDDDDDDDEVKRKISKIDDQIYDKYVFSMRHEESLPIHDFKDQVIKMIQKNPVTILEGDTGCGKTTQVAQYILDDAYKRREYCKIVCTQPRRIAAISIASRVCQERKWEVGSVVGYQVGLHAQATEDTRLLYCTTGVLLQKLIKEKSMTHYTHILLDEVHERDQDMDFLLIIVRRLLTTNSKNVKIILMSATINTKLFANYFKIRNNPAPVLRVDARRKFQVREFYLCQLNRINPKHFDVNYEEPGIVKELYQIAAKLVMVIDNIEKQEAMLNSVTPLIQTSILIFLPGINEINEMCKRLEEVNSSEVNQIKLWPIRLHSLISAEEQQKIFQRAPDGFRKVILATNIAESSITVPDVKYVVDFCLTKALISDTATNFSSLKLQWASRANCQQRAGRAGRVMNGRVYRLVSKHFYDTYLQEFGTPEMLRCPLENVVLKAKLLDMGPPPDIIGLAMDPPNMSDIRNTILLLKETGALYTHVASEYKVDDGDLSFMGRIMAVLPLDIRLSRLIIFGYMFSALEDSIIIAAGLSVRSIFRTGTNVKNEAESYIQKLLWADGSGSDLFAILRAYRTWVSMREQQNMNDDEGESSWARRYFINLRSIKEMHLLVKELKERLLPFGIKELSAYQRVFWVDKEKTIILKIIIAGAFYPNYFIRSNLNDQERERSVYHTLCGMDPCSTVYFTNFNPRYIGQLYTRRIKDLFKDVHIPAKNIDVRFQSGSERVFVSFKTDLDDEQSESNRITVPGRVRPELYKAVRMRQIHMDTTIKVMDPKRAVKYAEEHGIGVMYDGAWVPAKRSIPHPELVVIPSVFQKIIRGYITHIENCGKFYFQPLSEQERLREIHNLLNNPDELDGLRFKTASAITKGLMVSAPFENIYHRAKILRVMCSSRQHVEFKVFFTDYGNKSIVNFSQLRRLSHKSACLLDIPPRIFECRLAFVQPSSVKCPDGKWLDAAMDFMQSYCDSTRVIELEVYSIVDGISNVIIKMGENSLNEVLVEKGLARKSDENYMSKADHDFRMRKQSVATRFLEEDHSKQNEEYLRSIQPEYDIEVEPPLIEFCKKTIQLRGPFSALETTLFSAIRIGTWKTVAVERDSVNSVLLDTDPQDVHERLTVAASITETHNGDTLTARATTLMPNIHGFSALMTLLFCSTMQIKCNPSKTKYVAILAGLGYNERTMEPLFEEHDIVLNLDTDILKDDLELINQLRYSMDSMLYTDPGEERPAILPNVRSDLAAKIKNILLRLLSKNRNFIETYVDGMDSVWQIIPPEDIIETDRIYGYRSLFPMHSARRLVEERFDQMHELAEHCREMHRLRQFDGTIKPLTCRLCNQSLDNIAQLRIHLLSQLHRDREKQIRFKPQ